MPIRFSILLKLILVLLFTQESLYGTNKILNICRTDGVRFYTSTVPLPDIVLWTIEGGSISSSNARDTTPPVFYDNAGTFRTYSVSTFTSTGDISYDTFTVIVKDWPPPPFYFPKDTGYCQGTPFSITLSGPTFQYLEYLWSTGETSQSITVNTLGTVTLDLTIRSDSRICYSSKNTVTISEFPSPTVNLGNDKTMCQNQTLVLDARGSAGYKYLWKPNGEVTRTITATLPGIYTVEVTNSDNCKATDDIELIDSCPHIVYIPDAVSPNSDLLNDVFVKVWNFTPKDYTFSIYDRWGELIFETIDVNAAWNCKVNDELVQQDIYVYKITYVDTDKKFYELRGTFLVVR